jgi:hypothetical protein
MSNNIGKTKRAGGNVSASEIIKAGGLDSWAKKVGYDSSKIKMSGIITLTDKQVDEALKTSRK